MRTDVLDTALTSPAKELGLQNIERCKGFSAHLMVNFFQFYKNSFTILNVLDNKIPIS